MHHFRTPRILAATAIAVSLGFAMPAADARAQGAQNFVLATASTGGTYYPVGVALATLVKVKLQPKHKINMSAISSAGSGENIKLLRTNEAQFAILQGLYGAYAATGTGPLAKDGPQKALRSVTMLWANVEHFVVKKDFVKSGNMSDIAGLKGRSASLGARNSGTLGSNKTILGNLGYDIDKDFKLIYAGYGPSVDAMRNGQADLISTPAGAPVAAITTAFATMGGDGVRVLDFTADQVKKANGKFDDLWVPYNIKAGTYPGQKQDINTIAQPNFLAVRDDLPSQTIYMITKTVYENLPFLQSIHPATKAMSIEAAIAGLPLPLHPGAVKYYEEVGVKIPARLKR